MIARKLLHVTFVTYIACLVINRLRLSINTEKVKISYFEGEKQRTFCGLEILTYNFSFSTVRYMFIVGVTAILSESFIMLLR
jgi:hypothetical protein